MHKSKYHLEQNNIEQVTNSGGKIYVTMPSYKDSSKHYQQRKSSAAALDLGIYFDFKFSNIFVFYLLYYLGNFQNNNNNIIFLWEAAMLLQIIKLSQDKCKRVLQVNIRKVEEKHSKM
jgi:hypothetical protein